MCSADDLLAFYSDCEYFPADNNPLRPRELHIPQLLSRLLEGEGSAREALASGNPLRIELDAHDCLKLAPVILHESLFHFYKGLYNYLAARLLYFGGMLPWIKVSLYYANFYLARSVTVLLGKQSYRIAREGIRGFPSYYVPDIGERLADSKGCPASAYRIRMKVDVRQKEGVITFDRKGINSHRAVWRDYQALDLERLGLCPLTFDSDALVQERSIENYSFEGYSQLDFNLPMGSFEQFFERDGTKAGANTIYDLESGPVLCALSSQIRIYRKMGVPNLPVEEERLEHMIDYCLPDSVVKESLLELCREGFPTRNLHSIDGCCFADESGRTL